jgi:hypothetical protein
MSKYNGLIATRETNGLLLIFYDHKTIYVKHQYGVNVYHRWFIKKRYFYMSRWQPFRRALTDQKHLDIGYINSLANRYEIDIEHASALPDISSKKVRAIPPWGRRRNVH